MVDKKIEALLRLRDALSQASDALNDYVDTLAPREVRDDQPKVAEETFSILKFDNQQGTKLGSFDVAYKTNNSADPWTQAHDVLSKANATIQTRYYGKDYTFAYWLYGDGKIYRQQLKGASTH